MNHPISANHRHGARRRAATVRLPGAICCFADFFRSVRCPPPTPAAHHRALETFSTLATCHISTVVTVPASSASTIKHSTSTAATSPRLLLGRGLRRENQPGARGQRELPTSSELRPQDLPESAAPPPGWSTSTTTRSRSPGSTTSLRPTTTRRARANLRLREAQQGEALLLAAQRGLKECRPFRNLVKDAKERNSCARGHAVLHQHLALLQQPKFLDSHAPLIRKLLENVKQELSERWRDLHLHRKAAQLLAEARRADQEAQAQAPEEGAGPAKPKKGKPKPKDKEKDKDAESRTTSRSPPESNKVGMMVLGLHSTWC